uniref:Macrophage migration inhibitory factor homolog isoform X1 n=1 Tax=Rhizophora mucronata TaxID=61149 RepID=A0A2P2K2I1_RHIMU
MYGRQHQSTNIFLLYKKASQKIPRKKKVAKFFKEASQYHPTFTTVAIIYFTSERHPISFEDRRLCSKGRTHPAFHTQKHEREGGVKGERKERACPL